MGAPITWQNVNQGDVGTAWRGLETAARSINGAFDGLQGQVAKSEEIQAKNNIAERSNNTQSYLDRVAELGKTPELLQKAIEDGSIDRLKAGYGQNIDHAAVRGAAESLLNNRYAQVKAATDFNHFQVDEKAAPLLEAYKVAAMANGGKGDKQLMDAIHGQYLAAGGRQQSQLDAFGIETGEAAAERARKQGTYVRQGIMQDATIKNMEGTLQNARDQTAVSRGMLGVAQENSKLQGRQLDITVQEHLDNREAKATDLLGKARSADAGTLEGQTALNTSIEGAFKGDPNGEANARAALGDILRSQPGISTAAAMAAVLAQDRSRWYKNDGIVRGNTVDRAKESANTPEEIARQRANELQRQAALSIYDRAHRAAQAGPLSALSNAAASANPTPAPAVVAPPVVAPPAYESNKFPTPGSLASGMIPAMPSPALGGPAVPPTTPLALAPLAGMNPKDSNLARLMDSNNKQEQMLNAARKVAESETASKAQKAKAAAQVKLLMDAARNVRPEDLQ